MIRAKKSVPVGSASADDFLTEIYNRYGKKLYSYALKTWKVDEDAAWNLIYKTLYKVIETHGNYTFESEDKFASFVFRIFINYLRNHYRDKKQQNDPVPIDLSNSSLHAFDHGGMQVAETAPNEKLAVLNEVLDQLEDWQRMLLLMRSEGMSYSEIAGFIDKPENQLKVYYQRLKEQLTKKLHERV
jgi:RNA polymerase sigma factor (sigma-70 family)